MSAELILVLLQTSRLCLEAIERYQSGEMSDDELRVFARGMQQRLALANQAWEAAATRPEHKTGAEHGARIRGR